jgi:peptidoglycan hydrolase CwlO-like protein
VHAKARSSPVKAVVTVAVILIAVGGGLGYKMYTQHQAELAAEQAALDAARADAKRAQAEFESRMAAIQKEMNDKLANAKSEEERAKIRADAANARAQAQSQTQSRSRASRGGSKADATATVKPKNVIKREVSNDPLEGL